MWNKQQIWDVRSQNKGGKKGSSNNSSTKKKPGEIIIFVSFTGVTVHVYLNNVTLKGT